MGRWLGWRDRVIVKVRQHDIIWLLLCCKHLHKQGASLPSNGDGDGDGDARAFYWVCTTSQTQKS